TGRKAREKGAGGCRRGRVSRRRSAVRVLLKSGASAAFVAHRRHHGAPMTGAFPMSLTRYSLGLSPNIREEFKQAFDTFNKLAQYDDAGDQSNVVTSQWAPRVDIKEEANR